jgi:hypothetical protein
VTCPVKQRASRKNWAKSQLSKKSSLRAAFFVSVVGVNWLYLVVSAG